MRAFVTTVTMAVFGLVAAPVAQAETLADALAAAYKSSKLLDQNEALLRAQDEGVAQAVAAMRPVVEFVAQRQMTTAESPILVAGNYTGRASTDTVATTFQLAAQMSLYDFGRSKLGIEIAKETVLATREALKGLEQQILLSAVDAYVNFARQRPWQESVCSSLTELFAPHIHQQRISSWPSMYPWVKEEGFIYFKKRLTEARRDVEQGLDITLDYFGGSREMQLRALDILQFKLDVLWVIADAIMLACTDIKVEGRDYLRQPVIKFR